MGLPFWDVYKEILQTFGDLFSNNISLKLTSMAFFLHPQSHRIDVWYIFTYISHKNQPNVGEYTIHGSLGNGSYEKWLPETKDRTFEANRLKLEECSEETFFRALPGLLSECCRIPLSFQVPTM